MVQGKNADVPSCFSVLQIRNKFKPRELNKTSSIKKLHS